MATTSSSGRTKFTTPSDLEIVGTRVFDAPRQLVWDAHTIPQHVQQWLLGPAMKTGMEDGLGGSNDRLDEYLRSLV
jgi:hypothetical protein